MQKKWPLISRCPFDTAFNFYLPFFQNLSLEEYSLFSTSFDKTRKLLIMGDYQCGKSTLLNILKRYMSISIDDNFQTERNLPDIVRLRYSKLLWNYFDERLLVDVCEAEADLCNITETNMLLQSMPNCILVFDHVCTESLMILERILDVGTIPLLFLIRWIYYLRKRLMGFFQF